MYFTLVFLASFDNIPKFIIISVSCYRGVVSKAISEPVYAAYDVSQLCLSVISFVSNYSPLVLFGVCSDLVALSMSLATASLISCITFIVQHPIFGYTNSLAYRTSTFRFYIKITCALPIGMMLG